MKAKWCWMAKQYRKGWRVALCVGSKDQHYIPFWFHDIKDIERVLHGAKGKIVFVEMAK